MCKGIGYNLTYMPNQFNHDTQEEVGLEQHQFWPLVRIRCSSDLLFFYLRHVHSHMSNGLQEAVTTMPFCLWASQEGLLMILWSSMVLNGLSVWAVSDFPYWETQTDCAWITVGINGTPKGSAQHRSTSKSLAAQKCDHECHCREPLVPIKKETHQLFNSVETGSLPNCMNMHLLLFGLACGLVCVLSPLWPQMLPY